MGLTAYIFGRAAQCTSPSLRSAGKSPKRLRYGNVLISGTRRKMICESTRLIAANKVMA